MVVTQPPICSCRGRTVYDLSRVDGVSCYHVISLAALPELWDRTTARNIESPSRTVNANNGDKISDYYFAYNGELRGEVLGFKLCGTRKVCR